jgi:urease accessory protein
MKFLGENQQLTQGDILWQDDATIIAVDIEACDAIAFSPKTMNEMASVCYEIGNKHLPLFYENEVLLIPYEAPLFKLLTASGYPIKVEKRKLLHQLKTTVAAHSNNSNSTSLFSKIMQLTNPAE